MYSWHWIHLAQLAVKCLLLFGICSWGLLLALDPFGPLLCEIFSFKSSKSLIVQHAFVFNNPPFCGRFYLRQRVPVLRYWYTLGTGSFWLSVLWAPLVRLGCKVLLERIHFRQPAWYDRFYLRRRVPVLGYRCTLGTGSIQLSGLWNVCSQVWLYTIVWNMLMRFTLGSGSIWPNTMRNILI